VLIGVAVVGLPLYGDPDELDRLAGQLRNKAAQVRQCAADHQRRGEASRWVSTTARACRDAIAADRAAADRTADAIEQAAVVLQKHAQQTRNEVALIAKYERQATAWFEHQARSLAGRVEGVLDSVEQVGKRLLSDPPWRTWPIGPDSLPAAGDMKWLEVGDFMRRQGAI
jgi:hypothetical protein